MKINKLYLLAVIIVLSSCNLLSSLETFGTATSSTATIAATETAVPRPTATKAANSNPTVEATQPEVVEILAYCTLIGNDPVTTVPAGAPIIISWGWLALTEAQVQDHIDNVVYDITLDGIQLDGFMGDIWMDTSGEYVVNWAAAVGVLPPGTHDLSFDVSWKKMIYDGMDTYGPGGTYESEHDDCQIVVGGQGERGG